MSTRRGHCLCGAVSFEARELDPHYGICHCEMCRRWAGSAFFGITVPAAQLTVQGAAHVGRYRSSADWDRCWCLRCGATLWGHYMPDAAGGGSYEVAIGLFDDSNGLILRRELFSDMKSDAFALAGGHIRETSEETRIRRGVSP